MGLSLGRDGGPHEAQSLPAPEDVFLAWLLRQQPGEDLRAAAEDEILTLRRYAGSHPGPGQLLALFEEFRASVDIPQSRQ